MCIFKYKHFDELFCLYNKIGIETISHVENVSKIMNIFVSHLKTIDKYSELIKFDTNILVTASLLHDIGKVNIPLSILNSKEPLTKDEREIIKLHTLYGKNIVDSKINELSITNSANIEEIKMLKIASDMCLMHHEKVDGTGYLNNLSANQIPLYVRILSIADSVEAMSAKRIYKPSYSVDKMISILKEESGKQFNEFLVKEFLSIQDEWEPILY